jgi:tetratricopeptide (TPR) repeat protein
MSFTVREVSAMLGLSAAQIRAYAAKGVLSPERGTRGELRFGFQDLVILRTAGELSAAQVPERKVRRVLQSLREQLPVDRSIAGVRISADGDRVVVRDGDSIWNPESGQKLFDFAVSEIVETRGPRALRIVREEERGELDADGWFELGCDLELTSVREARAAYERAVQLDPRHADAHVNLGRMCHEEGAPAAAEKHYRIAIANDPYHPIAAFNLGVALEDLGRLADAAAAYRKAIEIDPDSADAHYNLAGILERKGDKPGALRHLKVYRGLLKS